LGTAAAEQPQRSISAAAGGGSALRAARRSAAQRATPVTWHIHVERTSIPVRGRTTSLAPQRRADCAAACAGRRATRRSKTTKDPIKNTNLLIKIFTFIKTRLLCLSEEITQGSSLALLALFNG